jgi:hypothetical protein
VRSLGCGRHALGTISALALLAGCGESQWPTGTPYATPPSALSVPPSLVHPDRRPSWMAPDAKAQKLLYVSDTGNDDVDVYPYPRGKSIGTLTGFHEPAGLCANKAGDIWVVNNASSTIVEYAHAGKTPKATLNNPGASALLGCSVDPTTGNLAVTDWGGLSSGGAGVWIYAGAKGSPKEHRHSTLQRAYFCGYDNRGNLFVDGLDGKSTFELLELRNGGTSLQPIALNQTVNYPGGVEWDGEYVAVGDQTYQDRHESAIDRISVSGSKGTVEGTTLLTGSCDVTQFWISNAVIAPDVCANTVSTYHYPAGGKPSKTLRGFQFPEGTAVSAAQ